MIKLTEKFTSGTGGFITEPLDYRQVKRTDKAAIYERSRNGQVYDYEVFLIKIDPKGKVQKFPNGTTNILEDDTEKYPSNNQFGRIAWACINLEAAERRFEMLKQQSIDDEQEPASVKEMLIPVGEFTVGELAAKNNVEYPQAFLFIKSGLESKNIKFLREERRHAKGKASKIYAKA